LCLVAACGGIVDSGTGIGDGDVDVTAVCRGGNSYRACCADMATV